MTSLLLISPMRHAPWNGESPYDLLMLASAAERAGWGVRVVDFNLEPLQFGLLADLVSAQAPQWVVLAPSMADADEAYRIGRFVKSLRGQRCVIFGGAHAAACPGEARARGGADIVARDPLWEVVPRIVRGEIQTEQLPHGSADAWPSPAFHRVAWQRYALPSTSTRVSGVTLRTRLDGAAHEERVRSMARVLDDVEELATLGALRLELLDEDMFRNPVRIANWCAGLRRRRVPMQWTGGTTVRSVHALTDALLGEIASSGCLSIDLRIGSGDSVVRDLGDASVVAAAARLRDAGLPVCVVITAWSPGETLTSVVRTEGLLVALGSTRVRGTFWTPRPNTSPADGSRVSRTWSECRPDRLSWVPATLADDVPSPCGALLDVEAVQGRLDTVAVRLMDWLGLAVYLPRSIVAGQPMTTIQDAAIRLYSRLGERGTVRDLVQRAGLEWPFACAGLAALALGRLVQSQRLESSGDATFFCSRPWTGFEVSAEDGSVTMCCWAKENYGNVNTDTIAEIWNGPAIRRMRRRMAAGRWRDICRPHCPYIAGYMKDPDRQPTKGTAFAANLALSRQEIAERREVLRSWPRFWKAAHSTQCNLDCIMCYQDRDNPQRLPAAFYQELPTYLPVMQELLLLGGEPLIIPEVRRIVEEVAAANIADLRLALITNGTVHDPRTIELIRQVKLAWVLISLDAATPSTYAHIRRPGRLDRALAGVEAWRALRDEQGFDLLLSFTVLRDNVRELAEFVELAHAHRVDASFAPVLGNKAGQGEVDLALLQRSAQRAIEALDQLGVRMPLARRSLLTLADRFLAAHPERAPGHDGVMSDLVKQRSAETSGPAAGGSATAPQSADTRGTRERDPGRFKWTPRLVQKLRAKVRALQDRDANRYPLW